MSQTEGREGYLPGPLDELVPGLRKKQERLPALPVHPRIVRPSLSDGTHGVVLLSFAQAQSLRAFHAALKPMVEAALLSELCAPRSSMTESYTRLSELTLLMFEAQPFDAAAALAPFALERVKLELPDSAQILALARREARTLADQAQPLPDEPVSAYRVRAYPARDPLSARLHEALRLYGPEGAFGREPGRLARTAADWLATQASFDGVAPTRAGIERLESLVLAGSPGTLRWLEPLVFQALCDLVAVYAAAQPHLRVEWGVSEPDAEGITPPPVLRVTRDDETFHVPLGEHILRWCVMPVRVGEEVPSLGAWAEHEFS
jgi:hypothetical protein